MKTHVRTIAVLLLVAACGAAFARAQAVRPADLKFPPLTFEPPDPAAFRAELRGGLRAYIQEDTKLPLFNITALIHYGELYTPPEKAGLGALMGTSLIKAGTKTREGAVIEDRVDFLGGTLNFMVGERTSTLSLSVLSKDTDEGLDIFFDLLRNPVFREDAVTLARSRLVEQLRQANDAPSRVLSREYERLLYGEHPLTRQATKASYEGVIGADLRAVATRWFVPRNVILAVSGDFDRAAIKRKIEKAAAGWSGSAPAVPALSKSFPAVEPGVYFIQKATNQGYISLGHLGVEDTNPDWFAIQVMNFILGGGSFTSRITTKVRSDEGLSYNQGSRFVMRWGFPGTFSGYVQTKSATVGYAISLIRAEIDRIRAEAVSDAEMDTAINFYLESFADNFQMPQQTMTSFATLEMTGKPRDWFKTYRPKFAAVTKERVREVAGKYLHPDKMAIMIVGDREPIDKGGDKWAGPLDKLGKVHPVTLRDPMTGLEIK